MDTEKYDYEKYNLNTNYVELVWSEFWRYVVNAPILFPQYAFYGWLYSTIAVFSFFFRLFGISLERPEGS